VYLEQLRSLCAVIDYGSYTQAARELHLTQPSVSQHVRSLEQALSVRLLDRIGGRMQPTEAGEVVYQHAREILDRYDNMRRAIGAIRGLQEGHLVVGTGVAPGNWVLPRIVARFQSLHPGVRFELRVEHATQIYERILRGSVDFGVLIGHEIPQGVIVEPLYRDRLVLVMASDHPLFKRWPRALPPAALADVPFISSTLRGSHLTRMCDEWLHEKGIVPRIRMEFHNTEAIRRVIPAGIGAAILFYSHVAPDIAAGMLKIVDVKGPPLYAQFVLARRPLQPISPAARSFLRFLVRGLQQETLVEEINVHAAERFAVRPFSRVDQRARR
jgi:DNA-binding transcriptional LysR family regulator